MLGVVWSLNCEVKSLTASLFSVLVVVAIAKEYKEKKKKKRIIMIITFNIWQNEQYINITLKNSRYKE